MSNQPTVIRISPTKQEFLGKRYYLCGHYFQSNGERLHRTVWSYFNGEIPEGYHVHHIDHDKTNNAPENLELVHGSEHMSHHQAGHGRPFPKEAHDAAAEWHGSEEGRQWHLAHYERHKHLFHAKVNRECTHCGKSHEATRKHTATSFCSNNCKSAYRRATGADNVERVCSNCSAAFTTNKYSKQHSCSRQCGFESARRKRAEAKLQG